MGWEGTADSMWERTVTYKSTQPVGSWVVPCRACVCTRLVSNDTSLVVYSLCISKVLEEAWLNMGGHRSCRVNITLPSTKDMWRSK